MSTRPSSPATIPGITLLARPVGIVTGFDQWSPWSVENEYSSTASPMIPPTSIGDWAQTAYRFPARSIAIVGKLPPIRTVVGSPRSATGRSTQLRPLGSVRMSTG